MAGLNDIFSKGTQLSSNQGGGLNDIFAGVQKDTTPQVNSQSVEEAVSSLPDQPKKKKGLSKYLDFTKSLLENAPGFQTLEGIKTVSKLNKAFEESKAGQKVKDIITKGVETNVGQGIVEGARGSRIVAPYKAIAKYIKGDSPDFMSAYSDVLKESDQKMEDRTMAGKVVASIADETPRVLTGVLLNLVPYAGRALSSGFFGAVSAQEQIQNQGEVTSLGNIAIDVALDAPIGNTVEAILKKPAKEILKSGFFMNLKELLKGGSKAGLVEGITEPTQSILKYANDYSKAQTREEKKAIIDDAKNYVMSGGIILESLVGFGSGFLIGTGANIVSTQQKQQIIDTLSAENDSEFTKEQVELRESFRDSVSDSLDKNNNDVLATTDQISEQTGIPKEVVSLFVEKINTEKMSDSKKVVDDIAQQFRKKEEDVTEEGAVVEEITETDIVPTEEITDVDITTQLDGTTPPPKEVFNMLQKKYGEIQDSLGVEKDSEVRLNLSPEMSLNEAISKVNTATGFGSEDLLLDIRKSLQGLGYTNIKNGDRYIKIFPESKATFEKLKEISGQQKVIDITTNKKDNKQYESNLRRTRATIQEDSRREKDGLDRRFGGMAQSSDGGRMEASRRLSEQYRGDGELDKLVVRQAERLDQGEQQEINGDTFNILRAFGFSDILVDKLEIAHEKGAVKNIVIVDKLEGKGYVSMFQGDTLYLNPEEQNHETYKDGSIIDHELSGHGWYYQLSKNSKREFYNSLKESRSLIRQAWEETDNPYKSYWEDTINQIKSQIKRVSTSAVADEIIKYIGIEFDKSIDIDSFIDRSLNIDRTIEAINAQLFQRGYSDINLRAEDTVAINEHIAMLAEKSASLEGSETSIVGRYISDIQQGTLKFGENAILPLTYAGEINLSITTLEKLRDRDFVSKQFISDLSNASDIKQAERDLIRDVLKQYPDKSQIPVREFAEKVRLELLPLEVKDVTEGPMGGPRYENIALPDDIRGDVLDYQEKIYESPIETHVGNIHFGGDAPNYFAHTRIEDMADGVTRRVLELQSDLMQKGRLESEAVTVIQPATEESLRIREEEISPLRPYRNIFGERLIREEIKQAAIDGKTTLLFPTGETAMKIEGLGETANFYRGVNTNLPPIKVDDLKVGMEVYERGDTQWIITDVLEDGKFKAIPKQEWDFIQEIKSTRGLKGADAVENRLNRFEETFDISGKIDTNNPIYKFYQKDIARYLKNKYKAKEITDENGVSWMQVDITPEMADEPVMAFRRKDEDKTPQEILQEAEALAYREKIPEKGPRDIVQAEDIAREADNYDDFIATIRGGDDAVLPFYSEGEEVMVTNPNYEKVIYEIRSEGFNSLEDFYNDAKDREPIVAQSIETVIDQYKERYASKSAMDTIKNRGVLSEEELKEILSVDKVEKEKKERSTPISKIELPENIQAMEGEIANLQYILQSTEEVIDTHPGKKLLPLVSKKEGDFLDIKDPSLAKTPSERKRLIERVQTVQKRAQAAFEGVPGLEDRYDDPDVIREQIEDYKAQQEKLKDTKTEIREAKKKYQEAKKAFYTEERDRIAIHNIIAKEERLKAIQEATKILRKEGRDRKQKVEAIKEYFYLTDGEMSEIVGNVQYATLSDKEFNSLMDKVKDRAAEISEHVIAVAEVERTITEMQLQRTENLQEALGFSKDLKKMTTEELVKFNNLLTYFEPGDIFLGTKEIQTLAKSSDIPHVKTHRQIIEEYLSKKTGIPAKEVSQIVSTDLAKFRSATNLAQQHPFFEFMVDQAYQAVMQADLNTTAIDQEVQELAKKARKSRKFRLIDVLVPTDDLVFDYLNEESPDAKEGIARQMTVDELKLAHYLRDNFERMRDYLVAREMLPAYRENYITHTRRSFLEAWLKGDHPMYEQNKNGTKKRIGIRFVRSFFRALKETVWDVHKLEDQTFKILDQKTGDILPLEKFFRFAMRREGNLIPSKNAVKAFMGYVRTFEKKRALDSFMPKIESLARALSPIEETEGGVVMNDSLLRFVKEWINTQKGRPVDIPGVRPGGIVDSSLRLSVAFTRFMYLAVNIPIQVASPFGEQQATLVNLGPKNYALGVKRSATKKGKNIAKKYEAFVGKTLWQEISDQAKDSGAKFSEIVFAGFAKATRDANIVQLLGAMTPEEFKSEEISVEKLATLKKEIGRWRSEETFKSIVGATSPGVAARQFKSWSIPIIFQTIENLKKIGNMALKKDFKGAVKSREMRELVTETALLTVLILAFGNWYRELDKKQQRNWFEDIAYRMIGDAMSFLQAIDPRNWGGVVIAGWAEQVIAGLFMLASTKSDKREKGVEALKKNLVPRFLTTKRSSREESVIDSYLSAQTAEQKRRSELAKEKYEELKKVSDKEGKEAANEMFKQIKADDPDLANRIKDLKDEDALGLTDTEKKMKRLGVENGQRARYVYNELLKMDSKEAANEYVKDLKAKKVITDKVFDQLKEMVAKDKPLFEDNQKVTKSDVINTVYLYARAIGSDPITAFDRIFSGQRIRRIDNKTIIVERMPFEKSQKIREEAGKNTPQYRLDHTIPLQLGGSNGKRNLELVTTDEWARYTPVENYLGNLLRDDKITKKQAQSAILAFKRGDVTFEEIKSEYK